MSENYKILVIDDEISICEGIQRALTLESFQVNSAFDGITGLNKIKEGDYHLVLIDVMMPGITGIDLIRSIHAVDSEIICIIITGYATVELAVQAIKQGAYDFLTKPFSIDELLHAVNQGLEHRRLLLEAKRTQAAEAEALRLVEETKRLTELDRAKKDFIRLVTHDLQAPVSAIETYIKMILQGYITPEDQSAILEKCLARSQEEQALIQDLLELGHLEVIETIKKTSVKMDESLRSVLEICQEQIAEKKINLQIEIDSTIPAIMAAPKQIKSLWLNLVSNAIKYTPENGYINIKLDAEPDHISAEISDTGIGIPDEDQQRLFTEFFRAKNAKALEIPGTGLGLAIVKRILDGLNGEIEVDSLIGKGSIFRFIIPVATPS
ncbi:MAG: hybrid sensor histidine kinase/response regulator [Anaerolineales bacterium]|nr:hybrid sensor histidine kinase/response regulator [Anaerolineales bacterium]